MGTEKEMELIRVSRVGEGIGKEEDEGVYIGLDYNRINWLEI